MKELIEKGNLAEAHPRQWAPFVIVGEGQRPGRSAKVKQTEGAKWASFSSASD
jgi:hypothetical protein